MNWSSKKYLIVVSIVGLVLIAVVLLLPKNEAEKNGGVLSEIKHKSSELHYDVQIPESYADALNIMNQQFDLSIKPANASEQAKAEFDDLDPNIIRYINPYQDTDVVMTKYSGKLKEDIILKKPGHPESFSYDLSSVAHYIIKKDQTGNLHFYDKQRTGGDEQERLARVFTIPAPFMIDANGVQSPTSEVQVIMEGSRLTLVPNAYWLAKHPYPIILDPTVEIHILNTQSYPAVSGPWTVRFTTVGTADLVITGDPENTIYDEDVEFAWMKCGDEVRSPVRQGNSFLYVNWECDEVAYFTVTVLKAGKHHQQFNFGGQVVDAYNSTTNKWWNGSWTRRRQIWFDNRGQSSNLTNFPAAVILNSGRVDYGQTQNLGEDIRFVDADGSTQLDYEIEKWDEDENETSIVWVEVPQIDASSDLDYIWMYYGNTDASDAATTTGVWDENFMLVQHLQEATSTDADNYVDSTRKYNHGTLTDASGGSGLWTGKFDGAMDFQGDADYINVPDPADGNLDFGSSQDFTISLWFKKPALSDEPHHLINKREPLTPWSGYFFFVEGRSGEAEFRKLVYVVNFDDASTVLTVSTSNVDDDNWHYVTGLRTGTTIRLYIDGNQEGGDQTDPSYDADTSNTNSLRLGVNRNNGSTTYFDGIEDEVRISNTARSVDWMAFEYCNMADTCTKYGAEDIYTTAGVRVYAN